MDLSDFLEIFGSLLIVLTTIIMEVLLGISTFYNGWFLIFLLGNFILGIILYLISQII